CRMAVELGRSELGFDRLGIWLYDSNKNIARGTFGTDTAGNTVDERGITIPTAEYGRPMDQDGSDSEISGPISPIVTGAEQLVLQDPVPILATSGGGVLGIGWSAQAALWDGKRPVGLISADNLINQRPLAAYQT